MRRVKLTYYKKSGKYYCDGGYMSNKTHDFEIYKEVRSMAELGRLPGLVDGADLNDFMIHVKPYLGVTAIIHNWRE